MPCITSTRLISISSHSAHLHLSPLGSSWPHPTQLISASARVTHLGLILPQNPFAHGRSCFGGRARVLLEVVEGLQWESKGASVVGRGLGPQPCPRGLPHHPPAAERREGVKQGGASPCQGWGAQPAPTHPPGHPVSPPVPKSHQPSSLPALPAPGRPKASSSLRLGDPKRALRHPRSPPHKGVGRAPGELTNSANEGGIPGRETTQGVSG